MHALWKGSLSFGLINIPVKMYNASQDHDFAFVLLHKKDLSQIRYARICKVEEKEVPWKDIVKGYEYSRGEYVVLEQEDFDKANLKKTKTLEIVTFSKETEIDSVFYSKPYLLEPDKGSEKAYSLLCEALRKSKKVGVVKYVLHNKEHIASVKPHKNILIVNQMRYLDELRLDTFTIKKIEPASTKELEIAIKLIDQLTSSFNPKEYNDTYTEELKHVIEQKAKGIKIKPKEKIAPSPKIHDIMSLLKASLEKSKPPKKKAPKKKKSA